jgi:hypothetical protein
VALAAGASAIVTIVIAMSFFPEGSPNLDEVAYQAQANALVDGRLTLPVAEFVPSFRPYLSGIDADRVVFKYQPLWPALIAASELVTGSSLPIRVVLSMAGVVACAAFANELVRSRRVAIIAAALFALSPFVWIQTATLLGYHLSLVLLLAASAALLRAARTGSVGVTVLGGALLGAGFLHRPFDAVIAAIPLAVYLLFVTPHRRLLRLVVGVAAGALPFIAVMLVYNTATMGSPFRVPFNAAGGIDTFGFGKRATFVSPDSPTVDYTVNAAAGAVWDNVFALPVFVFAWPAVFALAAYGTWLKRRCRQTWLLIGMVVATVVGYFFWWGTANLVDFGLQDLVGPCYHYLLIVPVVILAACAVDALWTRHAVKPLVAVLAVGVAIWLPSVVGSLDHVQQGGSDRADSVALLGESGERLMILTGSFRGDPYVHHPNDGDLEAGLVVAGDIEGDRLNVVSRFPNREVAVIRYLRRPNDLFGPSYQDRVPLDIVIGDAMDLSIGPAGAQTRPVRAFVSIDGRRAFADGDHASWQLRASDLPPDRTAVIVLGLAEVDPLAATAPDADLSTYECRLEARRRDGNDGGQVEMTTSCDYVHHYVFPNGVTTEAGEDLSSILDVDVQPQ